MAAAKEMNISVSLGSLFFMKDLELILEKDGFEAFQQEFSLMAQTQDVLPAGPSLGLVRYLSTIPGVKLSLISKLTGNAEIMYMVARSIDYYFKTDLGFNEFHQVIFSNGSSIVEINKRLNVDLSISTNPKSITRLMEEGIGAIAIDTPIEGGEYNYDKNLENYNKSFNGLCLISDFDGVIGDGSSEKVFQDAIQNNAHKPELEFAKHEAENVSQPLAPGPLCQLVQKVSFSQETSDDVELHLVTARGGHAIQRAVMTLQSYDIHPRQVWFMAGENKNKALEFIFNDAMKEKLTLFVDDSSSHYARSTEIKDLVSGLVAA